MSDWKDTVMSDEELFKIYSTEGLDNLCLKVAQTQAKISFKAGMEKAVKWIKQKSLVEHCDPDVCGKLRTKAEGGTTFTVCDKCWSKHYEKPIGTKKGK